MKNIIIILALLTATFTQSQCQSASAENSKPNERTAWNVHIGKESVFAYFQNAEFSLNYCGEVIVNLDGWERIIPAIVCQYEPGVWTATIEGGDYVKVWTSTGHANTEINGEFRTFAFK